MTEQFMHLMSMGSPGTRTTHAPHAFGEESRNASCQVYQLICSLQALFDLSGVELQQFYPHLSARRSLLVGT